MVFRLWVNAVFVLFILFHLSTHLRVIRGSDALFFQKNSLPLNSPYLQGFFMQAWRYGSGMRGKKTAVQRFACVFPLVFKAFMNCISANSFGRILCVRLVQHSGKSAGGAGWFSRRLGGHLPRAPGGGRMAVRGHGCFHVVCFVCHLQSLLFKHMNSGVPWTVVIFLEKNEQK